MGGPMNDTYTDEASDEAIAAEALSDREQFGVLMGRYEERLARYLARLGLSRKEDREDVLQDAFLKAYQNLASFNTGLTFSSWMYRIAHNEAVSHFRRRAARPEGHQTLHNEAVLGTLAQDETLTHELDASFDRARLASALNALPEKFRTPIVLYYFEHKSYVEISDILRVPPGTVATLLSRAKVRLKKGMGGET